MRKNGWRPLRRGKTNGQLKRKFVEMIASLNMDGDIVDGREFVLENDDAVETLGNLIETARAMTEPA